MNAVREGLVSRVDPRRPAVLMPNGLRRIVLGSSEGERMLRTQADRPAVKPLRAPGPFSRRTLVVAQAERGALDEHVRQVIAAAAILAGPDTEVVVAVLGECREPAAALGIDRLLQQPRFDASAWQPQALLQWLDGLVDHLQPAQLLMADRGADGELGRRYAAATGRDVACGVVELDRQGLRVRAGRGDARRGHAELMLLARGVADAELPFVGQGHSEAAPAVPKRAMPGVRDLGLVAGDVRSLPLEEAELIVAAGNGVAEVELLQALADELGAAVGASRVAVDKGLFARQQQIGATGKTVSAAAYVALGISGAVQHLQGIKDCRHVIAVNLDASAPIARRADLTVVEDCGAFMRAFVALVRAHRE